MDYGKDNYASVSFSDGPDGRRTIIGWMSNWQYAADVPTQQFRSANTLPREMKLFRADDGDIYLASEPSPELTDLRDKLSVNVKRTTVGNKTTKYALPANGICEILLDVDARKADKFNLTLSNAVGEKVVMTYNPKDETVSMDRRLSGDISFSADFPAVTVAPTRNVSGRVSLRIFIDRSSIELFTDNGRSATTNLVFPSKPYTTLSISAEGGKAKVTNLNVYGIKL